ncbi:MAG: HEAT repeat domain-containing protein [Anaerolineales bacterium]
METGVLVEEFSSGDAIRSETALRAVLQQKNSLQEIEKIVEHTNAEVRWWATRALAALDQEEAGRMLVKKLRDPDLAVRQCAALALSHRPVAGSVPELIEALKNEDSLLKRLAAEALVKLENEGTLALVEILDSGDQATQVEAARALAFIGDTRAVPALFKLAESDSVVLQHWASEGLEKMGVGMAFFTP